VSAPTPAIAIVGRPNVGKSTLFNRLVRARRSIVHDQPGVTRDRIVAPSEISPGRTVLWIDTGGLVPDDEASGLNEQVYLALEEADLVLLLVDGTTGPTPADQRVVDELRRLDKPVALAVNKSDTRQGREGAGEFWSLGLGEPVAISAEHGLGIGELEEHIASMLPPTTEASPQPDDEIAVAIVGRPNVGKSSLLNRILGESRVLVSPIPGTTRDPVDTHLNRAEGQFLLIDTAGIRRRSKVSGAPEELAVLMARRQIERAEVAVLVLDASEGVTSGDLAVAGAIWESGRAAVVAVNKWDLLDEAARETLERGWPRLATLLADPRRVNLSAVTGRGVENLFEHILAARSSWQAEISTGELNRLLETWIGRHSPPVIDGKLWKVLYATQVAVRPPTLLLFANRALPVTHPYRRYLENRLRETLDLRGVPVRLVVRRRST